MFPTNLHKNIVQLDRQISLLENECKSMEVEKRKKKSKLELSSKCSKISNLHLKSPPVKVSLKKSCGYECPKRTKKLTPPNSTRVHSTSSLQSSKPWSEICDSLVARRDKVCGVNTNLHVCSCQLIENSNHCDPRKEKKFVKCVCCKDKPASDLLEKDISERCIEKFEENKKDQVLHKEVLFSNPDGTIEVTVTKKSHGGKENSPCKKFMNMENMVNRDVDSCKCQTKGQKWSEILGLESAKRRAVSLGNSTKSQIITPDETHIIYPPQDHNRDSVPNQEVLNENNNYYKNQSKKTEIVDIPVKLAPSDRGKKVAEINSIYPEKEIQCYLDNSHFKESPLHIHDPIKLFQILVNELKQKPSEEKKKLLNDMESSIGKFSLKSSQNTVAESAEKYSTLDVPIQKNDFVNAVKQHCESLAKEKELLSEELVSKDNIIATMKKREEEYLSLISSLKSNLEKTKENAQDGITALKELNNIRSKLLEEIKISEALKKKHAKMQDMVEKYILENDKLKTQIQIFKLESEKHDVLLAGKEAEISRYKEEIKNFQRQISDHLASLKSNAQSVDVEKMMEAIIQQSHLFVQSEIDSVILEKDQRGSSQQQNVLMHSSPTSTKTSVVNSSWKQISSIRDQDQDQSKANSEVLINLNESDEKQFFQVFGGDSSSETGSSKKSKNTLIERLTDNREKKNPGYTSCISLRDGDDCDSSSPSEPEIVPDREKVKSSERNNQISQKAQSNIDELLQNMKLKWSKEVYGTSGGNCTINDFLNNSQISGLSLNSEKIPLQETSK